MSKQKITSSRRQMRVRLQVKRAANGRPRLSVFRSSKHIYAQIIDDVKGATLVAASSMEKAQREGAKSGANIEAASAVGKLVARELVVVSDGAFQSHELRLEGGRELLLARLPIDAVHLERIVHEVVQLPLILLPEVDQLVRLRPDAVVRARVVIARVVVVAVVHGRSPVRRRSATQDWQHAASLHLVRYR